MVLTPFLVAQALIVIAIITDTIGMHRKKKFEMLSFFSVSAFLIAVHFVLLQEFIPAIIIFGASVEFFIARTSSSKKWMLFFLGLSVITLPFLYENWYSFVALAAGTFFVVANFQKEERFMRILMMVGTSLWIVHNAFAQTPMGVVIEVIFLINNIWGYYRHYGKKDVMPDV